MNMITKALYRPLAIATLGCISIAQAEDSSYELDFNAGLSGLLVPAGGEQNTAIEAANTEGAAGTGGVAFSPTAPAGGIPETEFRHLSVLAATGTATTLDNTTTNQWTTSVMLRAKDLLLTPSGLKAKTHVRIGFIGEAIVFNPLKPQETLNKAPQTSGVFADFKIEWENALGKQPKLSVETKSWDGIQERKGPKFEKSFVSGDPLDNAAQLDGWFRVTLLVSRTGLASDSLTLTGTVEDLGDAGMGSPTVVGQSYTNFLPFGNAAFVADSTIHPVLVLENEKTLGQGDPGAGFYIDNFTVSAISTPGPTPPPPPPLFVDTPAGPDAMRWEIPFDSLYDLGGFDYLNQNSTTLGWSNTSGLTGANTGAGKFRNTATGVLDRRVLATGLISCRTVSGPDTQEWRAGVFVNASSLSGTPVGSKYKAQARLGYLGGQRITDPTKPQDVWKLNPAIQADFKMEWDRKSSATTLPKLTLEPKSSVGNNTEVKPASNFNTTTYSPANWYYVELLVQRVINRDDPTAAHLFFVSASVFDMGPTGNSAPTLLGSSQMGLTSVLNNPEFSTDTTLHSAFMLEGDKEYLATPYYSYDIDNLSFHAKLRANALLPTTTPQINIANLGDGTLELTWDCLPGWELQTTANPASAWQKLFRSSPHRFLPEPNGKRFYRLARTTLE
jgi:hypothetical protein